MSPLRLGLALFTGLALSGCVIITGPGPGDTGVTPTCDSGSVLFTPDGSTPTDVTATFAAGTQSVPATYEVSEPGTLAFCDGTFYATITVSADRATVLGFKGSDATILSGADTVQVVHYTGAGTLTVRGLTLTAGTADSGGALLSDQGNVEIHDSVLSENHGNQSGGALASQGDIVIADSTLSDNSTGNFGGAVAAYGALTITGSTISDNLSDLVGGGVFAGAVEITGSVFDNNSARNNAGGLYMGGGTLTDTQFRRNSSDIDGGGVYVEGGSIELVRPLFEDNDATESGGALYLSYAVGTCTGTAGERQGFFRNIRGVAVLSDNTSTAFSSDTCDFGESSDDNTVYDVRMIATSAATADFTFGDDARFACAGLTCQ